MRVVFDTNVLLSLWVFLRSPRGSQFAPLRRDVESGRILALSDIACLAEFERVLAYPAFHLAPAEQQAVYHAYHHESVMIPDAVADGAPQAGSRPPLPRCRDRDDQKFLELAYRGCAEALVTCDKALLSLARHRLLIGRFRIVTPDQFMRDLGTEALLSSIDRPMSG